LEAEQNELKRRWFKAWIGCLASFVFVAISVWACCAQLVWALDKTFDPPPEFCTHEDEIYQAILLHGQEWIEGFRSRDPMELRSGSMLVSMPSGKNKSVIAAWDWEDKNEAPQLRIIVDTFRDILQEYIYSPNQIVERSYGELIYLDNGVYCFDHRH
jgi:hypothetical protein